MTIITLRAYNREIEGLIDNGQLDEAVAHCRHILATFPKHIVTYRLLGKTHLEQQRISDATDIFQRVLSTIPDDFISNVGMSIIREDENNLDASIWHMELAYEAQPSNTAIQDELRRLYGRRDGIQPPKVRLTRGALARMYAKGGLFDQAVAELQAAISEDPNRYDLQLLLAGMYFQSSQRVEAVDSCVNILKKLPFCLAANQILAVCLPETEQTSSGKNYRQVAISMDPYFAFAAQDAITSDQVPENSVNIERLEWKSGIQVSEEPAQPSWATSLGVTLETKPDEVLPEWLKGTEAPSTPEPSEIIRPSVSPFIWDTQEVEQIITEENKAEGEIPDWMKDAGWKPASPETLQKSAEASIEQPIIQVQPEEDIEKGEVPEWLRGIAPEGMLDTKPATPQPLEKDVSLPWLEKQQPGPSDSIIQWLEDAKPETPVTAPTAESISEEITDEEIPDWLKDLDVTYPTADQEEKTTEEATALPSAPVAIIEGLVIGEAIKTQASSEVPAEGKAESIDQIEPIPQVVETPSSVEEFPSEELPAAFADELPDWIKELAGETPETMTSPVPVAESEVEGPTIIEEQPAMETILPQTEIPSTETLESIETKPEIESSFIPEAESTVTLPGLAEEQIQLEQPPVPEAESTEGITGVPGENAALAWLTGLAIQESIEEEKAAPVEEPSPETPEWVSLEAETTAEAVTPEFEPKAEEPAALPAEEIPDWIKGLGEIQENEEPAKEPVTEFTPEPEAKPIEEIPAWMLGSALIAEAKGAPGAAEEPVEKEEELPDWIKEVSEPTLADESPIPPGLAVTRKLPPLPGEFPSEWAEDGAVVEETGEGIAIEPQPEESAWVSIAETQIQPELAVPVAAEAEPPASTSELPGVPPIETIQKIDDMEEARNALDEGLPAQAAEVFKGLIKQNQQLDEVIKEVQEALYRFPVDINLWVVLGDAHLRTDELQDALDAYSKAEDLVR